VIILDYSDLYAVLENVPGAQEFFDKLPDGIKDNIKAKPYNVTSFEVLNNYAKSLFHIF
jgi:putative heme iron utilization protein